LSLCTCDCITNFGHRVVKEAIVLVYAQWVIKAFCLQLFSFSIKFFVGELFVHRSLITAQGEVPVLNNPLDAHLSVRALDKYSLKLLLPCTSTMKWIDFHPLAFKTLCFFYIKSNIFCISASTLFHQGTIGFLLLSGENI
jgi:hypothetical protein